MAALIFSGCSPKGADEPASELWLRVHCAGTGDIARDANSATLQKIAALPATAGLREALAQELITSLQQTLRRTTNAPEPDATDLLRPLLDEAIAHEFILECHGRSNTPTAWTLAVWLGGGPGTKPPPVPIAGSVTNRARQWETNYRALVARLDLGEVKKFNARSFGGWYLTQPDRRFIDYLEVGHWVIVGLGTDRRPMAAALERADKLGRPVPALSNAWLRAEGDLARFGKALPFGASLAWPRFDLTVAGRNSNLVTTAKLTFAQPLATNLPSWNMPTNHAQDPVISFTAARGTRELVQSLPFFQRLALTNAPDLIAKSKQ